MQELFKPDMPASTVWAPGWTIFPSSALNPGDQVIEKEEDQDQAYGHVAEDAAVVPAGSNHGGETFHAAGQQACGAQEVWILRGRNRPVTETIF